LFPREPQLALAAGLAPAGYAGGDVVTAALPRDHFRHLALLYRGSGEYLSALRAFVQACAARGDAVFVALPKRKAQLVRQELSDVAHMTLTDMAELGRNPARIIPAVLSYVSQHPGQNVCFVGEPIWPGRTAAEIQEATRHEALINLAFRDCPVEVLCLYDRARLPKSLLADVACTHPAVISDCQEMASDSYQGPPHLPPRCTRALSPPPAHAEALSYREDLYPVRGFVASRAERAGLAELRISDLVIATNELAGNTLRHTGGGGTVHIWRTSDRIICQVSDTGQITDPLARHRVPRGEELGGKGLWLVNQLCDLVQARTGRAGTVTRLHIRAASARRRPARS
jgi:anti-sigma regulatory factor (Ser/Thr protein kinase)